jgi:hypothetical protein
MLNPKSAYFKKMLKDGGYLARNIKNIPHPSEIEKYLSGFFDVNGEYFLGVRRGKTFPSRNPSDAAIYAIVGKLK